MNHYHTRHEQARDDDYLELVAEYMQAGMNQDDAEIEAALELERIEELRAEERMDADDGELSSCV